MQRAAAAEVKKKLRRFIYDLDSLPRDPLVSGKMVIGLRLFASRFGRVGRASAVLGPFGCAIALLAYVRNLRTDQGSRQTLFGTIDRFIQYTNPAAGSKHTRGIPLSFLECVAA